MPRNRGALNGLPWYFARKDRWKLTVDGKVVTLRHPNGDPIKGSTKASFLIAVAAANAMKEGGQKKPPKTITVRKVLDLYLEDCKKRLTQASLDTYQPIFDSFTESCGNLVATGLHPDQVKKWLQRHTQWGPSTRNLAGSVIKAAFAWAGAAGRGRLLSSNPLSGMRLPTVRRRSHSAVITQAEFDSWLTAAAANQPLCDLMKVAWETGTRPVNLSRAKVGDLRPSQSSIVIEEHKTSKKTGRPLVIPLTGAALAVVYNRIKHFCDGDDDTLIFRTSRGLPWNKTRLASLVLYYSKQVGLEGRLTAYSCRHSLATRLLCSGVSEVDVAAILGNTPQIIHRHYSHVAADGMRLRRILEKTG